MQTRCGEYPHPSDEMTTPEIRGQSWQPGSRSTRPLGTASVRAMKLRIPPKCKTVMYTT